MSRTRSAFFAAAAALGAAAATPAIAQGVAPPPVPGYQGQWQGHWSGANGQTYEGQWTGTYDPRAGSYPQAMNPQAMRDWQGEAEHCRDYRPSSGMTGAVIGGVVGGVAGNRIAEGDRTLGTVAGAAVGAVAGAAIDKGIDARKRQECQEFWARSGSQAGYPGSIYPGYGYAPYGYVWVPVMIQKPCVETTTTTVTYVDEPARHRMIPPRRHKYIREKIVPQKYKYIKE